MKMDVSNQQGEIVELEINPPAPMSASGAWTFTLEFPDQSVRVFVADRFEVKAILAYMLHHL